MEKKIIMGIDPSMRSTGVCVWDGSDYKYHIIVANPTKKLLKFVHPALGIIPYEQVPVKGKTSIGKEWAIADNIASVCDAIGRLLLIYKPTRVVMEACAFAAGGRVADLSGLNHCLRQEIRRHGIPVYVVPPTSNKLEFAGNGQATKDMMVDMWRMCDHRADELLAAGKIDDIADAFALCRFPESKLVLE